jgi:hypothetical protein
VEPAKALFADCRRKQARNFEAYLSTHQTRIVNYGAYQSEQLCSIGSGAVESAVKQIGRRLQISGACWNTASVNAMLSLRCAYATVNSPVDYFVESGMLPAIFPDYCFWCDGLIKLAL